MPGMNDDRGSNAGGNRRRLSRIVHDSRGTARVEWIDLPGDDPFGLDRLKLSLVGEPLDTPIAPREPRTRKKTDLHKLSEWIKLKRELEQRKSAG